MRPDALPRLIATPPRHCSRCDQETAYTAHLAVVIGRCPQLADRLDTRPSADSAGIAADVRRLASLLAGGLMDQAGTLDRSDSRNRHD